jgi:hypothetical protein
MKAALLLCAALVATPSFAETAPAPLAAGKPAGVKAAQSQEQLTLIAIGATVIILGVGIALVEGPQYSIPSTSP